ncbi:hypothetical protein H2515_01200 [Acidithiobacillus ferrivorans]|uniref:Uncharacterized protein n=1 Tax=Acidithiobacillus ferrivorans TaxID=160808 RepID=A0A7T5BH26_9PROT|nr:hypothetical protein H2515_01200 [Acidithiobacillus ferrivorans]
MKGAPGRLGAYENARREGAQNDKNRMTTPKQPEKSDASTKQADQNKNKSKETVYLL